MKKLTIIFLFIGLLVIAAAAQTNRSTRPRVVATPPPPQIQNDNSASTTRRPPVLNDRQTSPSGSQTNTQTASTDVIADDDDVIKIETNLVTMPVSVLDRDGRFISGLQQKDFQIFENNAEQKIEYFQSVEQPFTVVLLLDVSPSTRFQISEIQDAAIAFVNQLRRDDRVIVAAFDAEVRVLSRATNNRYELQNAIRQTDFGDGTSLYDAVDNSLNQILSGIKGRKAVVLFTDGVDTTSTYGTNQGTLREAEESDALIYPLHYDTYADMQGGSPNNNPNPRPSPRRNPRRRGSIIDDILGGILNGGIVIDNQGGGGRGGGGGYNIPSRSEYESGRRFLENLAKNSGGRFFSAGSMTNLNAAFSGIAEELRRQYSLGYYPETTGQKGERRQIRVRVMRPGLVVRAKNSYIVGEETGR